MLRGPTLVLTGFLLCFLSSSLPSLVSGVTWENFFIKDFFNVTFSRTYSFCINTFGLEIRGINLTVTDEFFIYYSNRTNRIFTDLQFDLVPCGLVDGDGEVRFSFIILRGFITTDMNWTQVCSDSYNIKVSLNYTGFEPFAAYPCARPSWHSALASPNNTHKAWCILTYNTGNAWLQWLFRDQDPITNITSTPLVVATTTPSKEVPLEIPLPLVLNSTSSTLSRIILSDFIDPLNNITFNNVIINTTDSAGQVKTISDLLFAIPSNWWQSLCGLLSLTGYIGAGVYSNIIPGDNKTFYVNCSVPTSRLNLSDIIDTPPTTAPSPTSPETTIAITTPKPTAPPEIPLPNTTTSPPRTEFRATTKSSSEVEYLRVIATNHAYVKKRQEEITSGYGILLVVLVLALLICVCTYGLLKTVVPRGGV